MSLGDVDLGRARLLVGDVRDRLRDLPDGSVHCVVTSPPYWGLRNYGDHVVSVWGGDSDCDHDWGPEERGKRSDMLPREESESNGRVGTDDRQGAGPPSGGRYCRACGAWRGQLGLEPTVDQYVENMVEVFRGVHRVLRRDGTLWLNLGDCYAGSGKGGNPDGSPWKGYVGGHQREHAAQGIQGNTVPGLPRKSLVGVPWRVAFALQAAGWVLRMDVVWHKPNPVPESVRDRPTRAHEYVFLFSKQPRYYYDHYAVAEPWVHRPNDITRALEAHEGYDGKHRDGYKGAGRGQPGGDPGRGRNRRSVWTIPTRPYPEAHFAVFPEDLVEPCILAGTSEHGACPDCGAPWHRETERVGTGRERPASKTLRHVPGHGDIDRAGFREGVVTRSKDWVPGCGCEGGASEALHGPGPVLRQRHHAQRRPQAGPGCGRHRPQPRLRRPGKGTHRRDGPRPHGPPRRLRGGGLAW